MVWLEQDIARSFERLRAAAERWAGENLCAVGGPADPLLWLYGSTMVEARVDENGWFVIRAFLVLGPEQRADWDLQLKAFASGLSLGRLVVDEDGDLALVHRVPPRADVNQLSRAIHELCRSADLLDDKLCQAFGGLRSVDRFNLDVAAALRGDQAGPLARIC